MNVASLSLAEIEDAASIWLLTVLEQLEFSPIVSRIKNSNCPMAVNWRHDREAVNENGGFRVEALPFCFGLPVLPFKGHVFGVSV
jgi:hypothetical protein